ncbi:hypothetical protein FGU65_01365 [Methanoculleus sp. FWC-SCC1]|uniref:Uncharacterized protein n=1 Tax=Methanoculleus frigidifontis TaxID=2584085 RepID=A0ABT8M6J3_9EURY|nr:hypothetical protein [Methanoculleus sp. FWC-SCC1]MDN7023559.1 hypothetical protein [Methanoculleus sp. FWC-SCC1]
MRTGVSFAKDWQLIKLARSIRRHTVATPILRRLLDRGTMELSRDIASLAHDLGAEDGAALRDHASERMEPATLMEGILLMWGIASELEDLDDGTRLTVITANTTALADAFADERIAIPYLKGYVGAIAPDASFRESEGGFTIDFSLPG